MTYEGMDFKEWIGEYPVHPVASLFPMIDDDALNALAEDIKKNGQREPILVAFLDGRELNEPVVVDGRNRFKACEIAGVEPEFSNDYVMEPHEIGPWVISHNLHRRHLTTSQRAMVGQGYLEFLKEEAKKRQSEGGRRGAEITNSGGRVGQKSAHPEDDYSTRSTEQAGKIVGVSRASIKDADFVAKNDPALAQQVRDSKVTVSAAAKRIRESLNPKPEPTPEEKAEKLARTVLKNPENISKMTAEIITEYFGGKITW